MEEKLAAPQVQKEPEKEKLMAISDTALSRVPTNETISLLIIIGGVPAVALVDSGSSNTFIDHAFAVKLNLPMRATTARPVSVAGGGTLITNVVISQCPFTIQKTKFTSDFKVLPSKGYDVVLGVSWLKQYNPTTFDWVAKTLSITKDSRAYFHRPPTAEEKSDHIC